MSSGTWSKVLQRQQGAGVPGRLQRLRLDRTPVAGRDRRRVQLPRPDRRRAVQLPAAVRSEQLRVALRPELAQERARPEDRRRVHPRASNTGDVVHPVGRPAIFNSNRRPTSNADFAGTDAANSNVAVESRGRARCTATFDQNFHPGGWAIDVPRPTFAVWFGDNWRVNDQLTINYGIRWDADRGVASPPDVVPTRSRSTTTRAAAGTRHSRHAGVATSATRTASTTTPTSRRAPASPTTSAARTTSSSAADRASTTRRRSRT